MALRISRLAISTTRPVCPVYKSASAPTSPRKLQIHIYRYPSNPRVSSGIFNVNSMASPSGATTPASSVDPSPPPIAHEGVAGSGYIPRYVDIGVNLTDKMYQGIYSKTRHHKADLSDVIQRALEAGCKKLMVTGSDLHESREAVKLAEKYPGIIYATVGVHPCSAHQFDSYPGGPDAYMADLEELALSAKERGLVTAFGEIGLDYDRFTLCPKDPQLKYFRLQLDLSRRLNLPLFLHSRAASKDFFSLLAPHLPHLPGGVVHSFTGTLEEMKELLASGLYIGINGCSLKTDENLEVVKELPLDRLMLETDGPWCEIRPTHASSKLLTKLLQDPSTASTLGAPPALPKAKKRKLWESGARVSGRNEPAAISHVAWAVAAVKGVTVEEVCEAAWRNSIKLFGLGEKVSD